MNLPRLLCSTGIPARGWLILIACWLLMPTSGWTATPKVRHEPAQPRTGEPVRVDAALGQDASPPGLILEYQVVAPGSYIARSDPRYTKDWIAVTMIRSEPGTWTATIPAAVQENRGLIRYRLRSSETPSWVLPPKEDSQGNFGYFVYDGLPAWRGAVNPASPTGNARELRTFTPDVLSKVPVYHFLTSKGSLEKVMWKTSMFFGGDRHRYDYSGTLVYEGVVYDHVRFRARGGVWRHAMGKNMLKFNFNPGQRFAAKDHYGRPYATPWDKLNLGACIQQGDYGMRGEQGMFDAMSYRLFNLAGVEAPRTHWVHLRFVTEAEETPADQYRGDFWGLYLAVEEIEGAFLKNHRLPDGNLYKIEGFQPIAQHLAKGTPTNGLDARIFLSTVTRGGDGGRFDPAWWQRNVDLQRYYSYRGILEAVHHYDVDSGKNYFFYTNTASRVWQVIPWDVDLTWGEHMYGGGEEPFHAAGVLRHPPFRAAYQERLAEIRDLLFNPGQIGLLLDEHAAMIWNGTRELSLADADRAKWDYHPIMSSRYSMRGKSDPGQFYFGKPENRFDVMVETMKRFANNRLAHLDRLLRGYAPPEAAKISETTPPRAADGKIVLSASTVPTAKNYRWRLAEVTDPKNPSFDPKRPWHYEIEPVWESEIQTGATVQLPPLRRGASYRARVRTQHADGRWSRWSEPLQWIAE